MKTGARGIPWSLLLSVVLSVVAALGCGGRSDDLSPGRSTAEGIDAFGKYVDSPRRSRAEGMTGVINAFPQDVGPVPAARGQDRRPGAAALPDRGASALAVPVTNAPTGTTLVLYDDAGPWGYLGELYAIAAGNLASRFGTWSAKPVGQYQAGDMAGFRAVIYVGSTYDQPLPVAFLDDVLGGTRPVIWIFDNIWQLANRAPAFAATYGFDPWYFDTSTVAEVRYKNVALTRYAPNAAGIMLHSALDPAKATVLATAVRADGTSFPWAVRSGNLTYIGENPFAYISERDRYLVFCDLVFDALAPATPERHRALVRIEDVSPADDPAQLRKIADLLHKMRVPFSVAVIPVYTDPLGYYSGGVPETRRLSQEPALVSALQYMVSRGGTLVLHGYTHQFEDRINPYDGVSADDFEFWLAHIDALDYVVWDGPVPGDSAAYASGRLASALAELGAAGITAPTIWEFPHYAASAVDARTISATIGTAYHRGVYFAGALTGAGDDPTRYIGQFFPYAVSDVYGFRLLPENLGSYEPIPYNNNPVRLPADIIAAARAARVVRDGVASFYFHPYHPTSVLKQIVDGVKRQGYTFVRPSDL